MRREGKESEKEGGWISYGGSRGGGEKTPGGEREGKGDNINL